MVTRIPHFQDVFFGPEVTRAMGIAFDKACCLLPSQPTLVKEVMAKRIIDLAREGDINPDHLCDVTLKSLGLDPTIP
jgi:hypothetical protein